MVLQSGQMRVNIWPPVVLDATAAEPNEQPAAHTALKRRV